MISIKPKDEEDTKIFRRLAANEKCYIKNPEVTRRLGRRYPQLFDEHIGYADIGKIWKTNQSVFVTREKVKVVPIQGSATRKKMKFKFYKIF